MTGAFSVPEPRCGVAWSEKLALLDPGHHFTGHDGAPASDTALRLAYTLTL